MMNFSSVKNIIIPSVIFLISASCIKEELNTREINNSLILDVGGAAPLGYAKINLASIFDSLQDKETLVEDDNGFLSLAYNHELLSLKADEIYRFPPYNYSQIIKNPLPTNIEPLDDVLPVSVIDSSYIDFGFSDENNPWLIDSILLLSGTINIDASLTPDREGSLKITFPGITKDGNPLKMELLTGSPKVTRDLDSYTIRLHHENAGSTQLKFYIDFTIDATDQTIPVDAELLSFSIGFSSIEYEIVYGKPGKSNFTFDLNKFNISAFSDMISGELYFENPMLKITTLNSFGVPLGIGINKFTTVNKQNERRSLNGPGIPTPNSPKIFNFPTTDQVGESKEDSLLLSNSGTNLSEILLNLPNKAEIEGELFLLPENDRQVYYIHRNSIFTMNLHLILPLHGYGREIKMSRNLAFQIDSFLIADRQEIQKVIFRLSYQNTFPVDVKTQFYFMRSGLMMVDSLFHEWKTLEGTSIHNPAETDTHDEWKYLDIHVEREKLDKMAIATDLSFQTLASTTGLSISPPEKVKIYSNQYIKIHIGVIAEIKLNTDEVF